MHIDDTIRAFVAAVQDQDAATAARLLASAPHIAHESLHVAAAMGLDRDARQLIAADRAQVNARLGDSPVTPLFLLGCSPFHGESATRDAGLLATARLLLEAGADPNTTESRHGVPVLYTVTGQRSILPIARLLLEAGANPTDGESIFHAAEHFHEEALELLLQAGADLDATGTWGNTALYFLLSYKDVEGSERVGRGFEWLLSHGAHPDVRSGTARETALHVAARRGQGPVTIVRLLTHGADVRATRADGASAWLLARRGGFDAIAALLEQAGASTRPLEPFELLLAACGRGDADTARRLATPALIDGLDPADRMLLPEAASDGRGATVLACLAAGFPVDTVDTMAATALHHTALHGRATQLRALLAAGASTDRRDDEHASTPLGWACFGADFVADPQGDYPACVTALLAAGARMQPDEYRPRDAATLAALHQVS